MVEKRSPEGFCIPESAVGMVVVCLRLRFLVLTALREVDVKPVRFWHLTGEAVPILPSLHDLSRTVNNQASSMAVIN